MTTSLGIDFGTDSVRVVLFDCSNGAAIAEGISNYPRWAKGQYCDAARSQYRQHPLDYLESLQSAVEQMLSIAPVGSRDRICGIGIDTTGSTPVAVNRDGTPLAMLPEFEHNPNAMFVLWKDHTAVEEAAEINRVSHNGSGIDYTRYSGGVYSPEWFWAKLLHLLRHDEKVAQAAWSWVEHCDWITAELCGDTEPASTKRSRCAAGHKAMWHQEFGGLPHESFLVSVDPRLSGIRSRLYSNTFTADVPAGRLSAKWAEKLGLKEGTPIGVAALDAHMGAVGAGIQAYTLVKVMGTSTCDMLVAPHNDIGGKLVRGICGQVDGSILPGMIGLEAGQSAFGDVYDWFRRLLLWPLENLTASAAAVDATVREHLQRELIPELARQAAVLPMGSTSLVALDWFNGRRTPDANPTVKAMIGGLDLGSDAPRLFRALVEATAFGSKAISDRFISEGIRIDGVIALGGVAKKSPFVMQILADVLNMPIKVVASEQTCALGAAMFAAVVAGVYSTISEAQIKMGGGIESEYHPIPENVAKYKKLYESYTSFGKFIEEVV